jgi:putative transcriptional regulator
VIRCLLSRTTPFPGLRYDAMTGLFQNVWCDYDPTGGRYVRTDPIRLAGGIRTMRTWRVIRTVGSSRGGSFQAYPSKTCRGPWKTANDWRFTVASKIIESVRSDMAAFRRHGIIDEVTMREFDAVCPPPVRAFCAGDVRGLRDKLKFSQSTLALHLHTSTSTVRKWERGDTRPTGPALKLLNVLADKGLQAIV